MKSQWITLPVALLAGLAITPEAQAQNFVDPNTAPISTPNGTVQPQQLPSGGLPNPAVTTGTGGGSILNGDLGSILNGGDLGSILSGGDIGSIFNGDLGSILGGDLGSILGGDLGNILGSDDLIDSVLGDILGGGGWGGDSILGDILGGGGLGDILGGDLGGILGSDSILGDILGGGGLGDILGGDILGDILGGGDLGGVLGDVLGGGGLGDILNGGLGDILGGGGDLGGILNGGLGGGLGDILGGDLGGILGGGGLGGIINGGLGGGLGDALGGLGGVFGGGNNAGYEAAIDIKLPSLGESLVSWNTLAGDASGALMNNVVSTFGSTPNIITGALGVPDVFASQQSVAETVMGGVQNGSPTGASQQVDRFNVNPIALSETIGKEVSRAASVGFSNTLLSEAGQQAIVEEVQATDETLTEIVDLATEAQDLDVTQDVMKNMSAMLAQQSSIEVAGYGQTIQLRQQFAADAVVQAEAAEELAAMSRRQQTEPMAAAAEVLQSSSTLVLF